MKKEQKPMALPTSDPAVVEASNYATQITETLLTPALDAWERDPEKPIYIEFIIMIAMMDRLRELGWSNEDLLNTIELSEAMGQDKSGMN